MPTAEASFAALALVKEWYAIGHNFVVGIDIGGTNTRVAVARANRTSPSSSTGNLSETTGDHEFAVLSEFKVNDVDVLLEELAFLGTQLQRALAKASPSADREPGTAVLAACLDAAGPIDRVDQTVEITNWTSTNRRTLAVSRLPGSLCPPGRTVLLNDLEATCHGVASLDRHGLLSTYFEILWSAVDEGADATAGRRPARRRSLGGLERSGPPTTDDPATIRLARGQASVVAAMGTGLGVGLLLDSKRPNGTVASSFEPTVLPLEHGHAPMCVLGTESPDGSDFASLCKFLSARLYDGEHAPEFEDICSGRGLVSCYAWARRQSHKHLHQLPMPMANMLPDLTDAGDIARRANAVAVAHASDPAAQACARAMHMHYGALMHSLQSLVVTAQARAVFLAGGNQVTNREYTQAHRKQLYSSFIQHSKADWLTRVSVFAQVKPVNLNLFGCINVACDTCASSSPNNRPM